MWELLKEAYDRGAWGVLGHKTWEEYVKQEFEMGRAHAYRLLNYAEIREALSPNGDIAPSEFQARPLAALKDPDQQREAWTAAVKISLL